MEQVHGYKVFGPDFTCRDYQYEVGKTYTHKGKIGLCEAGFHFCKNLKDCFKYYDFNPENKVAQVVALGKTISEGSKSVTNKIKIIKELSWREALDLVNTGKGNTGLCNSGHCNSGDWNSGDWNSGHCNSGHWNSGRYNSGDYNSGDWNSGMFNACNYANGLFNSKSPKISMFNKATKMTFEEFQEKYPEAYNLLYCSNFRLNQWIHDFEMTDEEKEAHPEYKTTGGYLKRKNYKEACKEMWDKLSETRRDLIKKLPNFNKDVFFEITGIKV